MVGLFLSPIFTIRRVSVAVSFFSRPRPWKKRSGKSEIIWSFLAFFEVQANFRCQFLGLNSACRQTCRWLMNRFYREVARWHREESLRPLSSPTRSSSKVSLGKVWKFCFETCLLEVACSFFYRSNWNSTAKKMICYYQQGRCHWRRGFDGFRLRASRHHLVIRE